MQRFDSRIPALFLGDAVQIGQLVELPKEEHRHLRALRLRAGSRVILLNGAGGRALAILEEGARGLLRIEECTVDRPEVRPYIALGIGLLADRSRFEWLIEKSVELGVSRIVPLATERSEGRHTAERARRIAVAALKQSQQSYLPDISEPVAFVELLQEIPTFDLCFLCHEAEPATNNLLAALLLHPAPRRVLLITGPEGGFSGAEVETARSSGAEIVSLGEARLRSETAALAALVLAVNFVTSTPASE